MKFASASQSLALALAGLLALPLGAQVSGAKTVVINEIARRDTGDHAVELYNYGPAQTMTNWTLTYYIDNGVTTLTRVYTFPAFTLARHETVVIHWTSGTDGAADLYTGVTTGVVSDNAELVLETATAGVDYVRWGAPSPTNQPADLHWRSTPAWTTDACPLFRNKDLNTRGSSDWTNSCTDAPTLNGINPGMVGTRRHGRLMINEFSVSASPWIEIYNPHPYTVFTTAGVVEAFDGGATPCFSTALPGSLGPGAVTSFNVTGCTWYSGGPLDGEIRLLDGAGEGWDYVAFNNLATHHIPTGQRWTGGDVPVSGSSLIAYRVGDLDTDNYRDWATSLFASRDAINGGQQGDFYYDEMGDENSSFALGSAACRGQMLDATQGFMLKEYKARASLGAVQDVLLIVTQRTVASPETWSELYRRTLTSQPAENRVFTTGAINVPIQEGYRYAFMICSSGPFTYFRALPDDERVMYGTSPGFSYTSSYPPAANTQALLSTGAMVGGYFLSSPGPDITPATAVNGEIGVAYSQLFSSATGTAPLTWSYSGAAIPGLTFNTATHTLSGTPSATGTYNFTISVTDANGLVDTQAYTVIVRSAISISTTSLPDAEVGYGYYEYLYPSGGQSPNSWTPVSGFPAWLTLSTYASYWGRLTGTPPATGPVSITVQLTDSLGGTDTASYSFTIQPAVQITTASLSSGQVGVAYTRSLLRSGGVAPFSWSIVSGMQPNGLGLDPNTGVLSGTPQAAGTFNFTVQISDYYGATDTQAYSLVISQPLMVVNTGLPAGIVLAPYPSTQMLVAGGTAPYSWSITSGSLPPGLTMTSAGLITGTPSITGSFACTIRVTDNNSAIASRNFTVSVTPPPDTPQWSQRALFGGVIDKIAYSPNYALDSTVFIVSGYGAEIYKSTDKGGDWQRILVDADNAGQYVTGIALSPNFRNGGATTDQKTIFLSGWSIGVWKSVDGGLTFSEQSSGLVSLYNINALAISPNYVSDRTLWLAKSEAAMNVYISTDAAGSWTLAGALPAGATTIAGFAVSPDYVNDTTLFCYTSDQIYRSVNGGTTWTSVYNPSPGITNLVVSPDYARDHTLWINAGAGELHRSRNGGTTWSVLGATGYSLDATARTGQTPWLFMRGNNSSTPYNLFRSDDQGDSWVPLFAKALYPSGASLSSKPSLSTSPLLSGPAVDLFSGSSVGVTASFDNGLSFVNRQKNLTAVDINDLCGGGGALVAATNNGWLKSADNGASWGQAPSPGGSYGIRLCAVSPSYATDDRIFLVTGAGGSGTAGLYRSDDAGLTFSLLYSSGQITALALAPGFGSTNNTLYMGLSGGQLYRSTNAGATFSQMVLGANCDTGGIDGIAISPNYASDGAVFISREWWGVSDDGPCRTTDFGSTWTPLLGVGDTPTNGSVWLPPNYNDDVISASYSRAVFLIFDGFEGAVYDQSGLWRSLDNGATWSKPSGQPIDPYNILYGRVVFSPNFASDGIVLVGILNARHEGDGILRSTNSGASFARLVTPADTLVTRSTSGLYAVPGFTAGSGIAVAGTQGSGLWRSTNGGAAFSPATDMVFASKYVNAYASHPVNGNPLYAATADSGVYVSDDDGLTFTPFSKGLPRASNAQAIVCPNALPDNPVIGVAGRGLWRWNNTSWVNLAGLTTGNYTSFTQDATYLYATRSDGVSLRSANGGVNWTPLAAGETTLRFAGYNNASGPTTLASGKGSLFSGPMPQPEVPVTASLWSVAQVAGPRYSLDNGANWTATPGQNDYALPGGLSYAIVQPLGINAVSGGREVVAGTATGLWLSRDGGTTWRAADGAGSGLELTSKNYSAVLTTTTAFSTTDLLVGATGSTTGGVYLSGDGGRHWTQVNQGFDPNNLSISSLVKTSCGGCPVQYYSGTYGSGVYTRTITVNKPPFQDVAASWCVGAGCTCAGTPASLNAGGGQTIKICGSNFLNGVVVDFDGVAATGCTQSGGTVITCTGTPAHVAGAVTVTVRNTDTRAKELPAGAFSYLASGGRTANSLRVAKSGSNGALTWTCGSCSPGSPAQVYRAQNPAFSLYLENYNGGTGGSYSDTGAVATPQNYFWSVE